MLQRNNTILFGEPTSVDVLVKKYSALSKQLKHGGLGVKDSFVCKKSVSFCQKKRLRRGCKSILCVQKKGERVEVFRFVQKIKDGREGREGGRKSLESLGPSILIRATPATLRQLNRTTKERIFNQHDRYH